MVNNVGRTQRAKFEDIDGDIDKVIVHVHVEIVQLGKILLIKMII